MNNQQPNSNGKTPEQVDFPAPEAFPEYVPAEPFLTDPSYGVDKLGNGENAATTTYDRRCGCGDGCGCGDDCDCDREEYSRELAPDGEYGEEYAQDYDGQAEEEYANDFGHNDSTRSY